MKRVRTASSSIQQLVDSTSATDQTQKYTALDPDSNSSKQFKCTLPPHEPRTFDDLSSYEAHYAAQHSHRCNECSINLPSSHLLQLHIGEFHDPFVALRRDNDDKTYKCFVETCDKVCRDWKKRRSHMIDKHGYPRNYDFLVVRDGIDGRSSLLRPGIDAQGHRKSSRNRDGTDQQDRKSIASTDTSVVDETISSKTEKRPTEPAPADAKMDDLSTNLASLNVVPSSISFGRQKRKTGFSKQ